MKQKPPQTVFNLKWLCGFELFIQNCKFKSYILLTFKQFHACVEIFRWASKQKNLYESLLHQYMVSRPSKKNK